MDYITIFTPTYNRAYILPELYQSLLKQTVFEFEWLIVDDGSTDQTETLVKNWSKRTNQFPIRYYKKENGGKHRAINYALPRAKGNLFFIVDSDDQLTQDAVETILNQITHLSSDGGKRYAGICNLRGYSYDLPMGYSFAGESLDCSSLDRQKYGIEGDKAEVFFTETLKKYPFPEFEGERFITEAIVWDRMAADGYILRFFNQIVYLCEYHQDGLTKQGMDIFYKNPKGYALYLRQSRHLQKYSSKLQSYFDVQFYHHMKRDASLSKIADSIGLNPFHLRLIVAETFIYNLLSRVKACITRFFQKRRIK